MFACDQCTTRACRIDLKRGIPESELPKHCPTRAFATEMPAVMNKYNDPLTHKLILASQLMNNEGQGNWSRLEETIEFTRLANINKVGLAFCHGLWNEAMIAGRILRTAGLQVVGVPCTVGRARWVEYKLPRTHCTTCNPVGQAFVLNRAKTEINVTIGLCVGDDMVFARESDAPVTTLICKDKVTGHNPAVALYTAENYFKNRLNRFKKKSNNN